MWLFCLVFINIRSIYRRSAKVNDGHVIRGNSINTNIHVVRERQDKTLLIVVMKMSDVKCLYKRKVDITNTKRNIIYRNNQYTDIYLDQAFVYFCYRVKSKISYGNKITHSLLRLVSMLLELDLSSRTEEN